MNTARCRASSRSKTSSKRSSATSRTSTTSSAPGTRKLADGSYIIDGSVPLRDLNRAFGWELPDEEATTLAGLVIHEAREIPSVGQNFAFLGFRFEVLKKRKHQVTQVKVTPEEMG